MRIITDKELENLWKDLTDIPFIENQDKELILDTNWYIFSKGTTRTEIWKWFDEFYSQGVAYLLNRDEKGE